MFVFVALAALGAAAITTAIPFVNQAHASDNGDNDDDDHGKKCKLPNGELYPGKKPQGCPPGLKR